jgi:hypothetical protein
VVLTSRKNVWKLIFILPLRYYANCVSTTLTALITLKVSISFIVTLDFGSRNSLVDVLAYGLDSRGTEIRFVPETHFLGFCKICISDQGLFPSVKLPRLEADSSLSRRLRMHVVRRLLHLHDLVRL